LVKNGPKFFKGSGDPLFRFLSLWTNLDKLFVELGNDLVDLILFAKGLAEKVAVLIRKEKK